MYNNSQTKKNLIYLLKIFIFIGLIMFLAKDMYLLLTFMYVIAVYNYIKYKNIYNAIRILLTSTIVILLIYKGGGVGIAIVLFWLLVVISVRAYKHRQAFMNALRQVEAVIFGKPLDRNKWKKGEFKKLKVKVKLKR